jgi:hypothetical protein
MKITALYKYQTLVKKMKRSERGGKGVPGQKGKLRLLPLTSPVDVGSGALCNDSEF